MPGLTGRRIVLGVTGGIAAYKAVEVCRRLVDAGGFVSPVLTDDAQRFVGAVTFSALASEPAQTSLFGPAAAGSDPMPHPIPHTRLGQRADLVIVAPATAKLLGKYAAGISDDLLTATLLATRAPVLVAPAMHTEMWEHPAVRENLVTLRRRGVHVIDPESGRLAGGDSGEGRLAAPERIVAAAQDLLAGAGSSLAGAGLSLAGAGDLRGVRVLVTAGGTREPIDAVRVITNRSSGKQGHAIAEAAAQRGAEVVLVTTTDRPVPPGIEVVRVSTAAEMQAAVLPRGATVDVVVMAAAVADFRPKAAEDRKIKKDEGISEILVEPTHDFLVDLGTTKPAGQVLVGFAAETDDVVANAAVKLRRKHLDLIVANDVGQPDAGFEVDTNRAILLDSTGSVEEQPLQTKRELADAILDRVRRLLPEPRNPTEIRPEEIWKDP